MKMNFKLFSELLDGGVDARHVSSADFEILDNLIRLAANEADEAIRSNLEKAIVIKKKEIAWRGNHAAEISQDHYLRDLSSAMLVVALALVLSLGLSKGSLLISVFFLTSVIISVFLAIFTLKYREKIWKDYHHEIDG